MSGAVTFEPTAADAVAVSRGRFIRGLRSRRFHVRLGMMAALGAMVGAGFDWLEGKPLAVEDMAWGVTVALAWALVLLGSLYLLLPRRSKRLFRQQRVLHGELTVSWTDHGAVVSSRNSRSETAWDEYHHRFETKAIFAFGINDQLHQIVPKRAMDPDQISDLRRSAERVRLA